MLPVRPATPADAGEVIRLAALMYESIGMDAAEPRWRVEGERHLRERLGRDAAVFVVDHPGGDGLVACAAGTVATRLPGPRNPTATAGYVQWVSTEPSFQRCGLARAVMDALLGWFHAQGVRNIELHATPAAEALYLSMGFGEEGPGRALRRLDGNPCAP